MVDTRRFGRWIADAVAGTTFSTPALYAIGWLARRGLLALGNADATVVHLSRGTEPSVVTIHRELFGSRVQLRLDLAFSGCRELLLEPNPGDNERHSKTLFRALVRDAELVVDVGANVGLYTYLAATVAPSARVLAYEPVPALSALIESTVSANGWQNRVDVLPEAVGAAPSTLDLYVVSDSDTEATLDAKRIAGRLHQTVTVRVVPLADVLASAASPLDRVVLKIDVEGHERAVLDGMEAVLASAGPRPDIIMEFLGRAITEDRIVERILGYRLGLYYITPDGMVPLRSTDDLAGAQKPDHWNFWLTPRGDAQVREFAQSIHLPIVEPRAY